jgi:glycosyltransferase involved in cell wall biosynthesis
VRVGQLLPHAVSDRALRRRVEQLAEGLIRLGVDAELMPALSLLGARANRGTTPTYDVVDAHGIGALAAFARASISTRRVVFTPHQTLAGRASRRRLARPPFTQSLPSLVARADGVICSSAGEARLTVRAAPGAVDQIHLVPEGVDFLGIERALPIATTSSVVLAMSRRSGADQIDRLVAALAGLDERFQLVVLGREEAGRSLNSLAAELSVAARLLFAGVVDAEERHRWLKTAHVVVALTDGTVFDPTLLEALVARTPIVASDTVAHREMAAYAPGGEVQLVPIPASPLSLADAIARARPSPGNAGAQELPSSATYPARVLSAYRTLLEGPAARLPLIRVEADAAAPKLNGRFIRPERPSPIRQWQPR